MSGSAGRPGPGPAAAGERVSAAAPAPAAADPLAAHAARVAALRRPGACGGFAGVPALVETHLSSVLVAGDTVWKLKKPLRTGFCDFSTLALRQAACAEELRLNRRTAPGWYLGVVPVVDAGDGPRLLTAVAAGPDAAVGDTAGGGAAGAAGGAARGPVAGTVLDWAVQMRRFDEAQRADRLAAAGRLGAAEVDALAAALARFHATLPPSPPGWGAPEDTRRWARDNLAELAALLADPAWAAPAAAAALAAGRVPHRLPALRAWTEARGAALAPCMAARHAAGAVRECHGDLHLGNVFWQGGAPVLFDALEFNPALRHIDTVGELAFPFMDLQAHGRPDLAWRFVSQVLEASGDWGALPLLPWWAAYRAAVRAKVALLSAAGAGPADRAAAAGEAARYLALAAALAGLDAAPAPTGPSGSTGPTRQERPTGPGRAAAAPRLVAMCGLSGSGKSVVAATLAAQLHGVRLRSDVERKRLAGLPADARGGAALYDADSTRRTYARLQALAADALAAGVPVVVDAASLKRAERDALRALAARLGAPFTLLLCVAPPGRLRARVQARAAAGRDPSDATAEVLQRQIGLAEWPGDDEAADTVRLDTDAPPDAVAARVRALAGAGA